MFPVATCNANCFLCDLGEKENQSLVRPLRHCIPYLRRIGSVQDPWSAQFGLKARYKAAEGSLSANMDWFKRKNAGAAPPASTPKSASPPPHGSQAEASMAGAPAEPTPEQKLQMYEEERKESEAEYVRRLESLAQILFDKSEENEQLVSKLSQQEEDMKVLIDKMVSSEKELETYKENQVEYKRRLEVLTDCLEDLARENMKLAARGAPASRPDDYEEDRMPTLQEVQMGKTKSEVAAESAAKEVPIKPGSRTTTPSTPNSSREGRNSDASSSSHAPAPSATRDRPEPSRLESSASTPGFSNSNTSNSTKEKDNKAAAKDAPSVRRPSAGAGGLVLPSKSKSKPDVRDSTPSKKDEISTHGKSTTPPLHGNNSSSSTSRHRRAPSSESDSISTMGNDPKALMVVLKKYKGQADSLRRVRPFCCPPWRSLVTKTCFSCYVVHLDCLFY